MHRPQGYHPYPAGGRKGKLSRFRGVYGLSLSAYHTQTTQSGISKVQPARPYHSQLDGKPAESHTSIGRLRTGTSLPRLRQGRDDSFQENGKGSGLPCTEFLAPLFGVQGLERTPVRKGTFETQPIS